MRYDSYENIVILFSEQRNDFRSTKNSFHLVRRSGDNVTLPSKAERLQKTTFLLTTF